MERFSAAIKFSFSQSDSILTIDQGVFIDKKTKFRNQQVTVLISVPLGKRISLPKSNSVSNYDDNSWEFQNLHNDTGLNQEFQMTEEGLKPVGETDKLDDKINERLNELDKMDKLDKLHKLDSLIELQKKLEKEIDQQNNKGKIV